MSTVLLLRHGETTWNREQRMQGWAPVGLTEQGHEQARAAGRYLAREYDVDRVVSSDLLRTRETTELVLSEGVSVDPEFDPAWRERSYGDLQGLTVEELFGGFLQYSLRENPHSALHERPPNGESVIDVRERVVAAWERLATAPDGDCVLVVTHGGPIFALLTHVSDAAYEAASFGRWHGNGSLTEISLDGPRVVREGIVPE